MRTPDHIWQGIVLRVNDYREADLLMQVLCTQGQIESFLLRSYHKPTSRQKGIGHPLTYVRLRAQDKPGIHRVYDGELLDGAFLAHADALWQSRLTIAAELLLKVQTTSADFFTAMRRALQHPYGVILLLTTIIREMGYEPQVDHCVYDAQTKVQGFSIAAGGFLCPQHASTQTLDITEIDMLRTIRHLFRISNPPDAWLDTIQTPESLFTVLITYLLYHSGIHLNSWDFYRHL